MLPPPQPPTKQTNLAQNCPSLFNRMSSFMFGAAGFNHCNHALVTMWILLQLEPTVLPRHGQMLVLVLLALQSLG